TNVMTMPPAPPCDRCGQHVVEAHYPDGRCPRSPRRAARKAVAVIGAIAGVIVIVVAALVLLRLAQAAARATTNTPARTFPHGAKVTSRISYAKMECR